MAFETPIAVFAYNRPARTEALLAVLRDLRPGRLLFVTDGPRQDKPEDAGQCTEVRRVLDGVDWPCRVSRCHGDRHLGCTPRVLSGLAWIFGQEEHAIILEDDLLPSPEFFPWAGRMLSIYSDNSRVMQVSGRNELGTWSDPDRADNYLSIAGGLWGFATWRRAWLALGGFQRADGRRPWRVDGQREIQDACVEVHLAALRQQFEGAAPMDWDNEWTYRRMLLGGLAVVPPVNLVRHTGYGGDSTHHARADHLKAHTPVGQLAGHPPRVWQTPRAELARLTILLDYLDRIRQPMAARRIYRSGIHRRPEVGCGKAVQAHLLPFLYPDDALRALSQFKVVCPPSPELARLLQPLEAALTSL